LFKTVEVEKGISSNVDVLFGNHSGALSQKGTSPEVELAVNLSDIVSAPFEQGEILGEIIYSIDGEIVRSN